MPHLTTTDGAEIHDTDQGSGQPIIFSHGRPLNSDAWQVELKTFTDAGFRTIAHDRRGHGRSSSTTPATTWTPTLKDRSHFFKDLAAPFYGANRDGASVSQGAIDDFWRQSMLVNLAAAYGCVKAFSETDQTNDLKSLAVRRKGRHISPTRRADHDRARR